MDTTLNNTYIFKLFHNNFKNPTGTTTIKLYAPLYVSVLEYASGAVGLKKITFDCAIKLSIRNFILLYPSDVNGLKIIFDWC